MTLIKSVRCIWIALRESAYKNPEFILITAISNDFAKCQESEFGVYI